MAMNFFNAIFKSLLLNRERELIIWPGNDGKATSYTGNDVIGKVAAIRTLLIKRRVGSGQHILLAVPVSIDLICALFAVQAIGAVPVLPPAKPSASSILKVIRSCKIRIVIIASAPTLLMKAIAFAKRFQFIPLENLFTSLQDFEVVNVSPEQAALISHSSGSTGNSKAVYRSHRVLLAQHHVLKEAFPSWPGQLDFPLFPNILLHNLAIGVTSVLPDVIGFRLSELEPGKIVDQLIKQNIQTITGNVFYFKTLVEHLRKHPINFPHVRAIGIGGSPVPEVLATILKTFFINADVYIIYGSSEAEPIAVRKVKVEIVNPLAGYRVGRVNRNLEVYLNLIGEVVVAGKAYAVGEVNVKGSHVAINNTEEALQTGDFGYLDEHDELYLTARKGNQGIYKGYQHYQLEHLIANDERVEKVAAIIKHNGFHVFVQGRISENEILDIFKKDLPVQLIKSINKRSDIPVDARHLSKILYDKVS